MKLGKVEGAEFRLELPVYPALIAELKLSRSEYEIVNLVDKVIGDIKDPCWRLRDISIAKIAMWLGLSRQRVHELVTRLKFDKGLLHSSVLASFPAVWPTEKWYNAIKPYREKEEENGQPEKS